MKKRTPFVVLACVVVVAISFSVVVSGANEEGLKAPEEAADDGVVAFYFHGNVRCATCKKIEAYADEAIHQGFPEALRDGALEWRVVNIDEKENQHFVQDFQLVTRSVVLAELDGDTVVRWKNLDKVWQLVRSKDSFVQYVQDEARDFLGAS